jgi:DTW domain-containing protein YfiP
MPVLECRPLVPAESGAEFSKTPFIWKYFLANRFEELRAANLARSTRAFCARGASVQRCDRCQLALVACICPYRCEFGCDVDLVLLLHHDEVFKPTNSGRLIADLLPANTYAFEWSRTQPDEDLLQLLAEPTRYPVVVFPALPGRTVHTQRPSLAPDRRLTLILLDGTWKQAGKMARASPWLAHLPLMCVPEPQPGRYAVRQALRPGQLATAEAAAAVLRMCGEDKVGSVLEDYFAVFNEHCLATRGSRPPRMLEAHERLLDLCGT